MHEMGTEYSPSNVCVISTNIDYPFYQQMEDAMVPTVSPEWVDGCLAKKTCLRPNPFFVDEKYIFRDVMACTSGLSQNDQENVCAGIQALGGLYSKVLTAQTTHLITTDIKLESEICMRAVEFGKIKVVVPDWFDTCLRLRRRVSEDPYLIPGGEIVRRLTRFDKLPSDHSLNRPLEYMYPQDINDRNILSQDSYRRLRQKKTDLFSQKNIYFCTDLGLESRMVPTLQQMISDFGGNVVTDFKRAAIFIGKYREGPEYVEANRRRLIVGNLTWIYWMVVNQEWSSPYDKLLHYPVPKSGLAEFRNYSIAITNYTGHARCYLEELIKILGAEFNNNMRDGKITHLIAAFEGSKKYSAARNWNVNIVNHLWLEESFAKWQVQSLTNRRYVYFPEKLNLTRVLGKTFLIPAVIYQQLTAEKPLEDLASVEKPTGEEESIGAEEENDVPERVTNVSVNQQSEEPESEVAADQQSEASEQESEEDDVDTNEEYFDAVGDEGMTLPKRRIRDKDVEAELPDAFASNHQYEESEQPPESNAGSEMSYEIEDTGEDESVDMEHQDRPGKPSRLTRGTRRSRSVGRNEQESPISARAMRSTPARNKRLLSIEDSETSTAVEKKRRVTRIKTPVKTKTPVGYSPRKPAVIHRPQDERASLKDEGELIRVLVTGERLDKRTLQMFKQLKNLGIIVVDKPIEATFVAAAKVKRTPNFLCALATVEKAVTIDYLTDCLDQDKKIYPIPAKYLLENTKEGNDVDLRTCLNKSKLRRQRGALLFRGLVFNISRNVRGGYDVISNITLRHGAQSCVKIQAKAAAFKPSEDGRVIFIAEESDRSTIDSFVRDMSAENFDSYVFTPDWIFDSVFSMETDFQDSSHAL